MFECVFKDTYLKIVYCMHKVILDTTSKYAQLAKL